MTSENRIKSDYMNINLNKIEETRFNTFKKEHYEMHKNKKRKHRVNTVILQLRFDSGIGIGSTVKCLYCNKQWDITDYEYW